MTYVSQTVIEDITAPQVFYTKIVWTLKNCSILFNLSEQKFESTTFTLNELSQEFQLFLQLSKEDKEESAQFQIKLEPCPHKTLDLMIKASLISGNSGKPHETMTCVAQTNEKDSTTLNLTKTDRKTLEACLIKDELRFLCEIHDVREVESKMSEEPVILPTGRGLAIAQGLRTFYEEQKFCDVSFVLAKNEACDFRAHSLVLMGVSSFFRDMLADKSSKSMEAVVDLSGYRDVTAEVIRGLLDYVYGCKSTEELDELKHQLFVLADKFQIQQLRDACEALICKSINKDSIGSILLLLTKYDCKLLRKKALMFVKTCLKRKDIIELKEFSTISKDMDLVVDLLG